jgi:peptide/nickel transport system permease protein
MARSTSSAGVVERARPARRRSALRWAGRHPLLLLAIALLGAVALLAAVGPLIWPLDPLAMDFDAPLAAPSLAHPMGTDSNGRDVLARFIFGARLSLLVGFAVVVSGLVVGGGIGVLAAISGPALDNVLMRVIDALAAFPPLILAMSVTVGLGVGLATAALGTMLSCVPFYARLIRSDLLRLRARPFVEATVALGAGRGRILLHHLLPHTAPTMLVQSASVFGYAILTIAGLGFVGLGAQIPEPEWGTMITDGLQYALTGQWWIALFPGLGVLICVVAANLLADHVRDILDPAARADGVR